jgi:dTDP-glucose 4,6-dehydratase
VRRRRVHRLDLRAPALLEHGDEVTVLDKLTYAGREENLHDSRRAPGFRFVRGAIEDPEAVAGAIEIGSPEAIVNFAAETHVDRSIAEPDAFVVTHALGTYVLLEAARTHELRYLQVSTDEVYGSIEEGTFTEESRCAPPRPTRRPRPARTCSCRATSTPTAAHRDLPRLEQLRPLPVPREADPADDPQRAARRPLPVYGDGMQVRNWIHATDFAAAIGHVLEHGVPGEVYNAGGPDECANIEVVKRIVELTGAGSVADRARHRPARARPPLLALLGEGARARLAPARALRGGPRADRRLVSRERVVVGADPLGRLPRVLRAPVRLG